MNNNNFLNLMEKRQSCRSFDFEKPVNKDLIIEMLNMAKLSPSACNAQPYEVFVTQGDKAKIVADAKMGNFNKFIDNCNTFLIIAEGSSNVTAKIGSLIKNISFTEIDIGIFTANLVNSASTLGLETCIIGLFDERKIKKELNIKNKIKLIIALGYPKNSYKLKERKRKPFDENIHFCE